MVASARTTQKVLTEFNVDERPPIIYEQLYGDFAMKGTNGANGPRSRLLTDQLDTGSNMIRRGHPVSPGDAEFAQFSR
jgi:hypothetical protein